MSRTTLRRSMLGTLLHLALSGVASAGPAALNALTKVPDVGSMMSMPHAGSRRTHQNGGQGRGAAARLKRAARTRRNIRARASKRRA